jgi:prefoldin subunit 5
VNLARAVDSEDPVERLLKEKNRIERTIASLQSRLEQVEQSLQSMES